MENRYGVHQMPRIVLGPFPNMLNAPPADTQPVRSKVDCHLNKVPIRVLGPFPNILCPVQPIENGHSNIATRSKNLTIDDGGGEFGLIGQRNLAKKGKHSTEQIPPTVGHSNGGANVRWPSVRKEVLSPPPPLAWRRQPPPAPVHHMRRMGPAPPADNNRMWIHQSKPTCDHIDQVCTRITGWPLYCAKFYTMIFMTHFI